MYIIPKGKRGRTCQKKETKDTAGIVQGRCWPEKFRGINFQGAFCSTVVDVAGGFYSRQGPRGNRMTMAMIKPHRRLGANPPLQHPFSRVCGE